jgi:hypothetical protein
MAGFTFKLEHQDGTPADPPVLHTAVPNWSAGDTIPLSAEGRFASSRRARLAPPYNQPDREAASPNRARPRTLRDDAADSP